MKNKLNSTWEWFKSFFNDDNGASTTRALNWIYTITLCSGLLFVIVFNAIKTKEAKLPPIDNSYVVILGLFLSAKVGQHYLENRTGDIADGLQSQTNSLQSTIPPLQPTLSMPVSSSIIQPQAVQIQTQQ